MVPEWGEGLRPAGRRPGQQDDGRRTHGPGRQTTSQKRTRNRTRTQLFGNTTTTEEGGVPDSAVGQIPFGFHTLLAQDHFTTPVYGKKPFWEPGEGACHSRLRSLE
jgi:hypothetical protein